MKQILIIITVLSPSIGFGQNDNSIPEKWRKHQYNHIVTLTKIDFYVNDTVIPFTLVQEPSGAYSFEEGHQFTEDSITFDYQKTYHLSKKQKDIRIPKVVFEKNKEIIKLYDFLSHFSTKNGGILNTYDFDFEFIPYIHELNYSFIFWKIGLLPIAEIENDSIIRLTSYKTSRLSSDTPLVIIYELSSAFTQIIKKEYIVSSSLNFELIKEVMIPLHKGQVKRLNETFQSAMNEELKFSTKTNQHDPFLIEFKNDGDLEIIERSDGLDGNQRDLKPHNYHSNFQNFVELVNRYGKVSARKIERQNQKF